MGVHFELFAGYQGGRVDDQVDDEGRVVYFVLTCAPG